LKNRTKRVSRFFSHFEEKIFEYIRSRRRDGLICGRIHTPGVLGSKPDSLTSINTGDRVENCTALVEHPDGRLELESFFGTDPVRVWRGS